MPIPLYQRLANLILCSSVLAFIPSSSIAQALTLEWDRSPDSDAVTHYQVYGCFAKDCTALSPVPGVIIPQPPLAVPPAVQVKPSWVIPQNSIGRLAVTAFNIAGTDDTVTPPTTVYNESDQSVSVKFNSTKSGSPKGPRLKR